MTGRTIVLVDITNNPTSVPPLGVYMKNPFSQITRATVVAGLFLVGFGGAGGYTYSATGLPSGLTLNTATGEITGTPAAIGHTIFSATVTDSATNTCTTSFAIDCVSRLDFEGPGPGANEHGAAYSYQFQVSGNTGSVTYAVTGTALPSGWTLSSSGLFQITSGAAPQLWTSTVTATDGTTGDTLDIPVLVSREASFSLNGGFVSGLPFTAGVPVDGFQLSTTNGFGPFVLSGVSGLPSWLTYTFSPNVQTGPFNPKHGAGILTFYGTPPLATYPLATQTVNVMTLTLTDQYGVTTNPTVSFQIANPVANQPQQNGTNVGNAQAGLVYNFVGATVTNAAGVMTVSGLQGPQGAQGPQGTQGPQGAQGAQGATGTGSWDSINAVTGSAFTTTSTTLVNITGLSAAVAVSHTYEFEAILRVQSSATGGVFVGINGPTGSTVVATLLAMKNPTSMNSDEAISSLNTANTNTIANSSGVDCLAWIKGFLTTDGTHSGNLTVQIEKGTSGTATVQLGSELKVRLAA